MKNADSNMNRIFPLLDEMGGDGDDDVLPVLGEKKGQRGQREIFRRLIRGKS